MITVRIFKIIILFSIVSFLFSSCEDNGNQTAKIKISLIDAPANYQKVLIDIQDVQVNTSGDENTENDWQSLDSSKSGVYDLLQLTNGEEAFLGEIELPEGQLSQVRLILGEGNQLTVDGNEINLSIPSGSESGLKLNIGTSIEAGVTYKLVIDFDAARSIVKAGQSGIYNLKPVIRASMEAQMGAIKGVVNPSNIESVIYAVTGNDSISTYPDEQGQFLIHALESGTYKVVAIPDQNSGFTEVSVENVEVATGEVTPLDTLKLVK